MEPGIMMGILLLLLSKRKLSRQQISEKFEISPRSVSRYCDALSLAGVPIISISGRQNGGISIAEDFVMDRLLLSPSEKERVISALRESKSKYPDSLNNDVIEKLKIMKSDSIEYRPFLSSGSLVIDGTAWNRPGVLRKKIAAINSAIEETRVLCFSYIDRNEYSTVRKAAPYSLVFKDSVWYAYCYCYFRHDFRLFKLSRMKDLLVSHELFKKIESDVYAKLDLNDFNEPEVAFKIRLSSTILSEIEDWLGSECISEENNQYVASTSYPGGNHLLKRLLSFGSSVTVLSPTSLIDELKIEARRIAEKY